MLNCAPWFYSLQGDPKRPSKEALWPCQTDIAEAYGLPGTTEGLQRIQNEVQRAITEGAHVSGWGGDDDGLGRWFAISIHTMNAWDILSL